MSDNWRAVANAVLYKIQFAGALGNDEIQRMATSLVHQPLWDLTVDDEYRALLEALDSGEVLDPVVQVNFSESEKRAFLTAVAAELDKMRPWPERPFREVPLDRWPEFAHLAPIARVEEPWTDLQPLLGKMFRKPAGFNREILPLRLKSGTEIAFLWPGWPGESSTALVALGEKIDPDEIVREILSVSPIDPTTVTTLPAPTTPFTTYEVTPLRPEFVGEHIPGNRIWNGTHVHYLTPAEREPYRVTVANGLLYNSQGALFDTSTARTLWTPQGGRAIFVMDASGEIYSSPEHLLGRFHHSSLLAGDPGSRRGRTLRRKRPHPPDLRPQHPLPPRPPLHPPDPRQPPPSRSPG